MQVIGVGMICLHCAKESALLVTGDSSLAEERARLPMSKFFLGDLGIESFEGTL